MKGIELNFGLTRRFHYNISDGCKRRAFWIPRSENNNVDAGAKVEQRWSFPLGWPRICALETLSQSITQLSITIGYCGEGREK
uniref:Uncharacterized protein n=1 Tax=Picea sitchensis TaxID=3332 RepID=A9NP37_PICSI|nr:unknown [Picea sitchensis]